jgi:hypothetical protein
VHASPATGQIRSSRPHSERAGMKRRTARRFRWFVVGRTL